MNARRTYPHVVECDAHLPCEAVADDGNLGVPLAEVVQYDKLGSHLDTDGNRLGCRTVERE